MRSNIRLASRRDVRRLLDIQNLCFALEWHDTEEDIRRMVQNDIVLVWEGYLAIQGAAVLQDMGPTVHMYSVEVAPAMRGYGIGRELVQSALDIAGKTPMTATPVTEAGARLLSHYPAITVVCLEVPK